MPFTLETGSGTPGANAYISATFFVDYHTTRGRSLIDPDTDAQWTTGQIEAAIVVASDFLDAKFRYVGIREKVEQGREWPRTNAFYADDGRVADGVPIEVQEACAELAVRQLSAEIAPDPTYDASLRPVERTLEQVGPIREEIEFAEGGHPIMFKAYPIAERKMKYLLVTGNFVERV